MNSLNKIKIEIYGESHAPEIGVRLYGIPQGEQIDVEKVREMLSRRRSGKNVWSTPRKEDDCVTFVSGLILDENSTVAVANGDTIEAKIYNCNVRSKDYGDILCKPRPSHADYAAYMRDGKISEGGGRFSGRMTAPLCVAGSIAEQILARRGIEVCAYISQIGDVSTGTYKNSSVAINGLNLEQINKLKGSDFPVLDECAADEAVEEIRLAATSKDSVGGAIECVVSGIAAGALGDALFGGLEGKISAAVYAVPAVKGVEFGDGFDLCAMRASNANDAYAIKDGAVVTSTNRSGGINGGISNGMPILLRAAIRPTPSIAKPQNTVDLRSMSECVLEIVGRHDACIVPRAVPCIESAVALAVLDEVLAQGW